MPIGIILITTGLLGKESINTNQNTAILNGPMHFLSTKKDLMSHYLL